MDEMAEEIHFVEVDIAASPDIAQNAGITGTPTVQVCLLLCCAVLWCTVIIIIFYWGGMI